MTRPIRVEIFLDAIRHNYLFAKQKAPKSRAWAVVKADAYGHGIRRVAAALADVADGFALLNVEDALALRADGVTAPIMLLEGPFDAGEVKTMADYLLSGAVHGVHQLSWLAAAPGPVEVWPKVNSGMNRLGFRPAELAAVLAELAAMPQVSIGALMTHFATADDTAGVEEQWATFEPLVRGLGLPVSAANSAALWDFPATHCDWVRPGICLYGCSPFADRLGGEMGLKAAMRLSADVIAVQTLAAGEAVGYGRRFIADKPMRVGIVACGYADGYPRVADNGTPVAVDGVPSGLVGRVSMDMLAVDLSDLPTAGVGSTVELWGPNVPIETVAASAGTIGYELMCAIAPRVPRVYSDAGLGQA
ncbi:alanine racemase [Crenobacter cavernae]|uniref:Alanine racemase n=1 Tax=Crenobacter cavernae TaxID=2290923 RepID=A0A345Y372_9NEIS|nr:alanine racemase [Crenobacter cavernae]AXK38374.1 alanine racemase [Crenobacter cavernae]